MILYVLIWIFTAVSIASWATAIYLAAKRKWNPFLYLLIFAILATATTVFLLVIFLKIMEGWMEIGSALD